MAGPRRMRKAAERSTAGRNGAIVRTIVLQQGGMTLDSISAHVGRHITEGIGKIAREALAEAYEEGARG